MGEKWCLGYAPRVLLHDENLRHAFEGRRAEEFYRPFKNPTASAGFEPANLGIRGQHATSAPPKPLSCGIYVNFVDKLCCVLTANYTLLLIHRTQRRCHN